jgi:hypothetical protein
MFEHGVNGSGGSWESPLSVFSKTRPTSLSGPPVAGLSTDR